MRDLDPIEFSAENGAQDVGRVREAVMLALTAVYGDCDESQFTPEFLDSHRSTFFVKASEGIDFTHFYQENGSKITRGLRGVLLKMFLKPHVENGFSEFCKKVGDLYIEIPVTASIVKPYFTDHHTGIYGSDDRGSCFRSGGENESNGVLIDESPSTGVLCIGTPAGSRYAAGRMVLWIKTATEAHLLNQYGESGRSGLPYSLFVRALEKISGAKITFRHVDSEGHRRGFLPVYTNNGNVVCTATEGNFLSLTDSPGVFACPECQNKFTLETGFFSEDGTHYRIGCSTECARSDGETCDGCGSAVDEDDISTDDDGNRYCQECYGDRYAYCEKCESDVPRDSMVAVRDKRGREEFVCESCRDNDYIPCAKCEDYYPQNSIVTTTDTEENYCSDCANDLPTCDGCSEVFADSEELDEDDHCKDCHVDPPDESSEEEEDIETRPVVTDVPVTS